MDASRLADLEEIKQLKARYFRLMDTKQWDAWGDVFSEDCSMDSGPPGSLRCAGGARSSPTCAATSSTSSRRTTATCRRSSSPGPHCVGYLGHVRPAARAGLRGGRLGSLPRDVPALRGRTLAHREHAAHASAHREPRPESRRGAAAGGQSPGSNARYSAPRQGMSQRLQLSPTILRCVTSEKGSLRNVSTACGYCESPCGKSVEKTRLSSPKSRYARRFFVCPDGHPAVLAEVLRRLLREVARLVPACPLVVLVEAVHQPGRPRAVAFRLQ